MTHIHFGAAFAILGLASPMAADPLLGNVPRSPEMAQSFEAAMARIEARVVEFASPGGVVSQFIEPYEPMPLPDPKHLIDHNKAVALYWTTTVDEDVEDFLLFQVSTAEQMYAWPWSSVWYAPGLAPGDQTLLPDQALMSSATDVLTDTAADAIFMAPAMENSLGFFPDTETNSALLVADDAGLAADTGFFGDQ